MRQYFLIPGVQYGEESDVRSEQAGIGRDGKQVSETARNRML
jgi:hypothetical protein